VRIDDKLTFHPKVVQAGNEAVGAWVRMLAYAGAHLTDGRIPAAIARSLATEKQLATLLTARMLDRTEDAADYQIHDYLDWNPPAAEVKQRREYERAKKRGQRGGGTPPVPPTVPWGHPPGQSRGHPSGQSEGHPRGHTAGLPEGHLRDIRGDSPGSPRAGARVPARASRPDPDPRDLQPPAQEIQDRKAPPPTEHEQAGGVRFVEEPESQTQLRAKALDQVERSRLEHPDLWAVGGSKS